MTSMFDVPRKYAERRKEKLVMSSNSNQESWVMNPHDSARGRGRLALRGSARIPPRDPLNYCALSFQRLCVVLSLL